MKYVLWCSLLGKKNFIVKGSLAANNKYTITYTLDKDKATKFDSAEDANQFLSQMNNPYDRTFICYPMNNPTL